MRRAVRSSLAVALATALVLASSVASAREPTPDEVDRARTFFNAGAQAYEAARYAEAARSFEEAQSLAPRPQLLFSLAQAERKEYFAGGDAGYLRRAIAHYREYLAAVTTGGRRSEATEAKADLEARLARLDPAQQQGTITPTPADPTRRARVTVYSATIGARVSLDGGPPQELPYFGDLPPGKHTVRVSADGYFDAEREVSGDRPVDQPVDLPLRERPALVTVELGARAEILVDGRLVATSPLASPIEVAPGPHVLSVAANGRKLYSAEVVLPRGKPFTFAPRLENTGQRLVAYTLLGLGAVNLVTGAFFALGALGEQGKAQDIQRERESGNLSADRLDAYNRSVDRRDSFRYTSLVTVGAGAALVTGGALLYFLDQPTINVVPPRSVEPGPTKPRDPVDLTASPLVGPGLWGGSLTATF